MNFDLMNPPRCLKDLQKIPGPHLETHCSKHNLIFPWNGKEAGKWKKSKEKRNADT